MPVEVRPTGITWTPRGTFSTRVGKPLSPPKTTRMPPHRPPRQIAKRTIVSLSNDPESVTMLESLIQRWLLESNQLEVSVKDQTITERLAQLMFEVDVTMKIKEQEQEWDPTGNGTITLGEFRQHVRGIGIEATSDELDALFADWDTDKSGAIDMEELLAALHNLQREFLQKYGKNGWKGSIDSQVESLRARAAAGKAALAASAKADTLQAELDALLKDIAGRLPVQVGLVVVKRRIRVGEVVGSWCKTKGNSAKRELSKAEFKDETFKLGVQVNGEMVTRKALGELFDSVDTDHSGWLDLEEAKAALRGWEEAAIAAERERTAKERQVRRSKSLAARKLQAALREPTASPGISPPNSPGGYASDDALSSTSSPLNSPKRPASPKRRPVTAR